MSDRTRANGGAISRVGEGTPLLGGNGKPGRSAPSRFRQYMNEDVSNEYASILLQIGYIVTGLSDSSALHAWSSFASMQTGNTIYIGLGVANASDAHRWRKATISVAAFCVGSLLFSRWHYLLGPKRRWVMVGSYVFQLACIIASAWMAMLDDPLKPKETLRWQITVPLALMAFQAGGQTVTSRAVQLNMLTSVVLTSIYCDLFSDMNLFAGITQNKQRNQRVVAPILLLLGAYCGGMFAKSDFGIAGGLWAAAGLKLCVTIAWALWWKEEPKDDED